ncbi:hypothetical protein JCM8547_002966 [Rhodosporidiobolus lusitaniae]
MPPKPPPTPFPPALRSSPSPQPLPLLIRLTPVLLTLLLSLLILPSFFPSPWTSSPSTFSLFLRPSFGPPPLVPSPQTQVAPVCGCRDDSLTTLEGGRENTAIVVLCREEDLEELLPTLENFEAKGNRRWRYPYVFLSSPDAAAFSPSFQSAIASVLPLGAVVEFSVVPAAHWEIPPRLDEENVRKGFKEQERRGVQYAGREGYHHMVRWYSGLWVRSEALAKYDWFWRLEPGVRYFCDITYDPIRFLAFHQKIYGFTITVVENENTIPSLFSTVKRYMEEKGIRPEEWEGDKELWRFLTHKGEQGEERFSGCHFWTNMEIGDLRFFRSREYQDFFQYLDEAGGFYHERWGDAPVRTLALGLFARLSQIHHFSDLGYQHDWFFSCPRSSTSRIPSSLRDTLLRPGRGIGKSEDVVGCRCECPKEGESQGREKGRETVDMARDWKYSCLEQWEAAVRRSEGVS